MRASLRLLILLALPVACTGPDPQQRVYDPPPPPVATSVSPTLGSADGGAPVMITGTGLQGTTIVRFGGIAAARPVLYNNALHAVAPAHAPGLVDVEVTNGGQSQTSVLRGAYTFVDPSALDFNGTWQGNFSESEFKVVITVESNAVTAVSCGNAVLEMSSSPTISNGRFAYTGPAGSVTGRILSPNLAEGTISLGPCSGPNHTPDYWGATK